MSGIARVKDGRFVIARPDGTTIFNTDDRLFHVTNTISGSQFIAGYVGGADQPTDLTTVYPLGSVNSKATQIIGAIKFTVTSGGVVGLAYNRWHMVMGGSVVWLMDGEPGWGSALGSNLGMYQMITYHFEIVSGQARLVRRMALKDVPAMYEVLSHTITYKLRAGIWV